MWLPASHSPPEETNIIRIGNSQGIRIPMVLLAQSRLGTEVELEVEDENIVIRSVSRPRQGWGEKARG
jgi:antitoxin MazE